jgi:hypothetical protein
MRALLSGFNLRILPPRTLWCESAEEYDASIAKIQRFRGTIYYADGAIPAEALDAEGRHHSVSDERSYHVCVLADEETMAGCFRLRVHRSGSAIDDLCLAPALTRIESAIRPDVSSAISGLMAQAWRQGMLFGEVGGWAVQPDFRRSRDLIAMPLVAFAVYEQFGSALVIAHATHRHSSARILKEIGGFSLTHEGSAFSPYHDSYYGSLMEFVCFDSRRPAERLAPIVHSLKITIPGANGATHGNHNGAHHA